MLNGLKANCQPLSSPNKLVSFGKSQSLSKTAALDMIDPEHIETVKSSDKIESSKYGRLKLPAEAVATGLSLYGGFRGFADTSDIARKKISDTKNLLAKAAKSEKAVTFKENIRQTISKVYQDLENHVASKAETFKPAEILLGMMKKLKSAPANLVERFKGSKAKEVAKNFINELKKREVPSRAFKALEIAAGACVALYTSMVLFETAIDPVADEVFDGKTHHKAKEA